MNTLHRCTLAFVGVLFTVGCGIDQGSDRGRTRHECQRAPELIPSGAAELIALISSSRQGLHLPFRLSSPGRQN